MFSTLRGKIILAVVVVVLLLAGTFWLRAINSANPQPTPVDPQPATPQDQTQAPGLMAIPKDRYAVIPEQDQVSGIQNAFNLMVQETPFRFPLREMNFLNAGGQRLPLSTVASTLGIRIPEQLIALLDPTEYNLFYCATPNSEKSFGLVLYGKLPKKGSSSGNNATPSIDEQVIQMMRQWEPFLLDDLHPVLYPTVRFSDEKLAAPLTFSDGTYRYANLILPDGSNSSINYQSFGNPLVITSSKECLTTAQGYFFDEEE